VKASAGALAIILALSLGVWTYFYVSPGAPLNASETAVVVGVCAGAVLLVRWIWGRSRKTRGSDGQAS
jgi:hypothetical protein